MRVARRLKSCLGSGLASVEEERVERSGDVHDYEGHEVDAGCLVGCLDDVVGIVLRVVVAEFEPHCCEWYALAFHVWMCVSVRVTTALAVPRVLTPECHGEGQETLEQSHHEVCVEDESGVHEAILLGAARRALHQVRFRLFVC